MLLIVAAILFLVAVLFLFIQAILEEIHPHCPKCGSGKTRKLYPQSEIGLIGIMIMDEWKCLTCDHEWPRSDF